MLRRSQGQLFCTDDATSMDLDPDALPKLPVWIKVWLKHYKEAGADPVTRLGLQKRRTLILLDAWKPLIFNHAEVLGRHIVCNSVWWLWPNADGAVRFTSSSDASAPKQIDQYFELRIPLREDEERIMAAISNATTTAILKQLITLRSEQDSRDNWFSVEMAHWTLARSMVALPGGHFQDQGVSQAPPVLPRLN